MPGAYARRSDAAGVRQVAFSAGGSAPAVAFARPVEHSSSDDVHQQGTGQSSAEGEPTCSWEERGTMRHLSLEFFLTIGKQFFALSTVLVQIYYSKKLMMSCDSRQVGMSVAVVCEYTKANVRCFPLLAFIVSLIVAFRMVLCQRMYYKMLKKRAIIDFHPVFPGTDILYLVLSWSACSAFLHFILELCMSHPLTADDLKKLSPLFEKELLTDTKGQLSPIFEKELLAEIDQMASLYVLPSLIFLAFLWQSYDLESRLLPLSKYFEEDPVQARRVLASMHFLPEDVAAHVVKQREFDFQGSDGEYLTADEVFTLYIKECEVYKNTEVHGVMVQFSNMHLISGMWPGRLLLDHRLADRGSHNFRVYWFVCCALGLIIIGVIVGLLVEQLWGDVQDIRSGQYEDLAGFVVEAWTMVLILYVTQSFIVHHVLPYVQAITDEFQVMPSNSEKSNATAHTHWSVWRQSTDF